MSINTVDQQEAQQLLPSSQVERSLWKSQPMNNLKSWEYLSFNLSIYHHEIQ